MNSTTNSQVGDGVRELEGSTNLPTEQSSSDVLFGMEYGPLIDILSFLELPFLVDVGGTCSFLKRASHKTFAIREWTLPELYKINMSFRNVFQKYSLLHPKKLVFVERKLERVFGTDGLKKIFVYYEDYISSDSQLRMFPLYVNPNNSMEFVKMLFCLVWGNYPVRSGSDIDADLYNKRGNSSMPYSQTGVGGYADYFKSSAKWGEILLFTHHYVNPSSSSTRNNDELSNEMKIREILDDNPVIYCQVKGIVKWGEMYSYSPTYRPYRNPSITIYLKRFRTMYINIEDDEDNSCKKDVQKEEIFELVKKRMMFINYLENLPNEFHGTMKMDHFLLRKNNDDDDDENINNHWGGNLDYQCFANESRCNFKIFKWLYKIMKERNFTVHRAMG